MKEISIKESDKTIYAIKSMASKAIDQYLTEDVKVVVMEEDIEDQLLPMCRQHVQFLCDDLLVTTQYNDGKGFTDNMWAEAGEQVYAEWRGWL